jgi:chromosome segregation ATPase
MIDDTIAKIQQQLQQAAHLSPEKRGELQELIAQLKTEISSLREVDPKRAQTIASFAEASAHQATRPDSEPEATKNAIVELESSVTGFEAAHPQLTAVVNRIASTLSNLGI